MTIAVRAMPGLLALAAAVASCDRSPLTCADELCRSQVSWKTTFQTAVNRKVDVLFVVDDTPAMAPHAGALATGLADTAQRLLGAKPKLSLHVGFVRAGTCDQTTRGAACNIAAGEQFLRSEWCGTITNAPAPNGFADAFACLADLGTSDCAPAQPLAAAVQALTTPARPGWEGFLREDAYLMIVIVAAADDASGPNGSPTPISSLVASLKALKPDPSEVLVSVAGPGDCAADEVPGPRLTEFVNAFGANGLYLGLCSPYVPDAVDSIVTFTDEALYFCATNVRDTDLTTPGLQASCTMEDHMLARDGSRTSMSLPSCDTAAPPCWGLVPGGGPCATGYLVDLPPGPDACDEEAHNFTIECLGCATPNDAACAPTR